MVHRDIKPSNLMVTGQGQVKILDLGLGLLRMERTAGEEVTPPHCAMGTFFYMAPEQATDPHHVDIRADLYSLGCTFYELLTGQPPFSGQQYPTDVAKIMAHAQKPVPLEPLTKRGVPGDLVAVVTRLMAKLPADRYATPAEVATAVAPFAAGCDLPALVRRTRQMSSKPSVTPPLPPLPETTPWPIRRRPLRLVAILVLVFAVTISVGVVIRLRDRWGRETQIIVPPGTQVGISEDGQKVDVRLPPVPAPPVLPPQEKPPVDVPALPPPPVKPPDRPPAFEAARVIEPWFPGAKPGDTPPEPPPGPPPVFAHEDLHQFLTKTLKPMRTPQLWRMLYTEIATTIARGQPGRPATWVIGSTLTSDGKAYEIAVRTGGWFPRIVPPHEAAEKGIQPRTLSRNVAQLWRLPVKELVSLGEPDFRVMPGSDGGHTLVGRIRCVANVAQPIEHLALVIEFPSDKEDAKNTLYQHYRITEIPSGWLKVKLEIDPAVNLKHAPRLYLQAFLARPEAGFFRISNELLWMGQSKASPVP
jgi:serine/threonine protein kinase